MSEAPGRPRPSVWIVNHYADAPDRPHGTRHFELARQLAAHGFEVTVFAAGFSHVTGREERLRRTALWTARTFDGVRFVWVRTFPYRGNTWRRQVNMLSFVASFLVVQTRFPRPATVIGSTVHPFAALAAWFVARARRARFLFEVRDLWPQTLVDLGAMRVGSPGERMLRAIEAFLVRRGSAVITLVPGMRDYLAERRLPTSHVVYLPNGVDLDAFEVHPAGEPEPAIVRQARTIVEEARAAGRFVIGYTGAFGMVNRLDVVVQAAADVERRRPGMIAVVLIGEGPEKETLRTLATGIASVRVGPAIPRRWIPTVLDGFDATVVHATATPVYRYGISFNKLFEYMAAERPVVFACESAYDPVASAGAGVTVAPDDPPALADAFIRVAALPLAERAGMGRRGREYVAREHNVERLGARLASLVRAGPVPDAVR